MLRLWYFNKYKKVKETVVKKLLAIRIMNKSAKNTILEINRILSIINTYLKLNIHSSIVVSE